MDDLIYTHKPYEEHGENPKMVTDRLGYSSIKTTLDTYLHVTKHAARNNPKILGNNFERQWIMYGQSQVHCLSNSFISGLIVSRTPHVWCADCRKLIY